MQCCYACLLLLRMFYACFLPRVRHAPFFLHDSFGYMFQRAPRDDCMIFKDAKVVIFYSNDLLNTPRRRISLDSDDGTIETVRGLVDIERWVGTETIGRSRIQCPSIIVSYQFFMNGVDRVDQMRSTNPTKRKETKIHMSIWTYCLDLVIHQAYCIYKVLIAEGKISEIRT